MSQKILVFSGKKGGGKNTLANFICGMELLNLGFVSEFEVSTKTKGQLWVKSHDGVYGQIDFGSKDPSVELWAKDNIWPFVKQYAYADELKTVCINVLGLTHKQCYGTNADKESFSNYHWEQMAQNTHEKTGVMTAREVVQYIGTNIFRKIDDNIWINACLNHIEKDAPELAVITDARYANEIMVPKSRGAKIIRLTRKPYDGDNHCSETSLDEDVFDWANFDYVLDNKNMTIEESCAVLVKVLKGWGWLNCDVSDKGGV